MPSLLVVLLFQAEKRLAEEVDRVKNYLDESTEPKITRVAENELIAAQVRECVCHGNQATVGGSDVAVDG